MSYEYYGYGYGGGYYQLPPPGGYLDARNYLDGPGTHAYLQSGNYSSYAYEGQNGSIFEQNTTTNAGGYRQSTSYAYTSSTYHYGHYSDNNSYNPPLYRQTGYDEFTTERPNGYYGSYGSPYGDGIFREYNASDIETHTNGSYVQQSSQSVTEVDEVGGYYKTAYHSSNVGEEDGMRIPGSYTNYSASSYGYLSYQ